METQMLNTELAREESMDPETKLLLSPSLETVLIVEKYLQKYSGEYKKKTFWQHLPKKINYVTFCIIFNYLLCTGKASIDREGKIGWIWDPKGVKRYKERMDL